MLFSVSLRFLLKSQGSLMCYVNVCFPNIINVLHQMTVPVFNLLSQDKPPLLVKPAIASILVQSCSFRVSGSVRCLHSSFVWIGQSSFFDLSRGA